MQSSIGTARRHFSSLRGLHVTTKLMLAFAFMLLLTTLVGFEGIQSAADLNASSHALFDQDLMGISAIKEAAIFQIKSTRILRDLVLSTGDKESIEDQKQVLTELQSSVDEWLETARKAFTDQDAQTRMAEIKTQIPAYRSLSVQVAALAAAGNQQAAASALKKTNSVSNKINLEIAEICRLREAAARQSRAGCEALYRRSRINIVGCTIFSALFTLALCLLTIRLIARPLTQVMKTLQRASDGDLTARSTITNHDEIGSMALALNTALESTCEVLRNVQQTAESLHAVYAEVATTAEGMSQGANAQAAGLEKTSASLEQISATARNNTEHARQANVAATLSREAAHKGHAVVNDSVHAMNDIHESSLKISQIASAVDEVAFQTNLLSINAAIEAARAGEQGKSFAVVAEEIRSLSSRSANSARDIRNLIHESMRTVEKGSDSIRNSGQTLQNLSESVNTVTDYVTRIVASSEEQSIGVEQVHSAVLQMDQITQANVAQASKLTSVATSLSDQSTRLHDMLSRFRLQA